MISAQVDQVVQEILIEKYMMLPNQVWDDIISQASKVRVCFELAYSFISTLLRYFTCLAMASIAYATGVHLLCQHCFCLILLLLWLHIHKLYLLVRGHGEKSRLNAYRQFSTFLFSL